MIKIITQELEIESNLKQRLEFICEFCHIKPTIINGSIRKIDKTNLSYIEPHKIIVKDTTFLAFNYSTDIYVGSLNKEYGLNNVLKTKQKGRNKDINVKDMGNYIEMQEELSKNKERLEIASIKSLELDNNSNEVKDIVNNLKTTFTNKDKYVSNKDDKDKIDNFIQQVDSTNKEYKKMQKLSITLNDVETELKENREKVRILTENNDALNIKVKSLEKKIDKQKDEIDDLKDKNSKLQNTINFFENLFDRLVKFIKDKMFGKEKEREDYWNFSKDLYTHNIFSDKTIESIKDDYIWNKENNKSKDKGKDDYEMEI